MADVRHSQTANFEGKGKVRIVRNEVLVQKPWNTTKNWTFAVACLSVAWYMFSLGTCYGRWNSQGTNRVATASVAAPARTNSTETASVAREGIAELKKLNENLTSAGMEVVAEAQRAREALEKAPQPVQPSSSPKSIWDLAANR